MINLIEYMFRCQTYLSDIINKVPFTDGYQDMRCFITNDTSCSTDSVQFTPFLENFCTFFTNHKPLLMRRYCTSTEVVAMLSMQSWRAVC